MDDTNNNTDNIDNTDNTDTNPTENELSTHEPSLAAEPASKWYSLDSQKKKVAAGVGAGALTFLLGFGAAALVADGDHGRHGDRRHDMAQRADGQRMPQQGDWQSQPFDSHRGGPQSGGPQWNQQWGGQQMPQQGQMPSGGSNSGMPSQSHGS